jgi:ribosome-associated toxin RatA of RatAB toxin-antitoxin module
MEEQARAETETKEAEVQAKVEAKKEKEQTSMISDALSSPLAKQIGRKVVRGVFGMLFGKKNFHPEKWRRGCLGFKRPYHSRSRTADHPACADCQTHRGVFLHCRMHRGTSLSIPAV